MTLTVPDPLTPPLRFSTVQDNVYRGAYPRDVNLAFLRTLQLKTIISLTPEPISPESDPTLFEFCESYNVQLVHFEVGLGGKGKKRAVPIGYHDVLDVLHYIVHSTYAPIYVHCVNGGQITSLVVACLRKLQFWSSITIFNEFIDFTTNITVNDRTFVEGFSGEIHMDPQDKPLWLWAGFGHGVAASHPTLRIIETSPKESSPETDDGIVAI